MARFQSPAAGDGGGVTPVQLGYLTRNYLNITVHVHHYFNGQVVVENCFMFMECNAVARVSLCKRDQYAISLLIGWLNRTG